uniref:SH2 domain-containing adapter protein F n=1 Tax=Parastrongyloides trichosuri TaxID=131310 RepID=A0A0N5A4Q0_PARTI
MQRISSWFEDHLPLRRRRSYARRSESMKKGSYGKSSQSATPAYRVSPSQDMSQSCYGRYPIKCPPKTLCNNYSCCCHQDTIGDTYSSQQYVEHHKNLLQQQLMSNDNKLDSRMTTSFAGTTNNNQNGMLNCKGKKFDDEDEYILSPIPLPRGTYSHNRHNYHHRTSNGGSNSTTNSKIMTHSMINAPSSLGYSNTLNSTASFRQSIRTNPWIHHRPRPSILDNNSMFMTSNSGNQLKHEKDQLNVIKSDTTNISSQNVLKKPNLEMLYASMDRNASLRVKSLDESTCSSGYGSQDSSPESSVHSPNWQQSLKKEIKPSVSQTSSLLTSSESEFTLYAATRLKQISANMDTKSVNAPLCKKDESFTSGISSGYSDEPIYHELEMIKRLSMLEIDEDSEDFGGFCSDTELLMMDTASSSSFDCTSPIYAVPFESETTRSSKNKSFYDDDEPIYADVVSLKIPSRSTPSPQPIIDEKAHLETAKQIAATSKAEFEFLEQLDKQIADLQQQSEAMKKLVEEAKERDEIRQRNRQLCLKELSQLRNMKWIVRNNFELCL